MNALARETSPYLLQHAGNPVDWMPWGEEAFRRARELNRPIFLSVGYSTCHWCHVMARESFENPHIAELMNRYFVNVKVDREERPDVDRLYMSYVQAVTGSGGWPMSVWLTPEGAPFYGGTYFPPEDFYGRIGFAKILRTLGEAWLNRQAEIREVAGRAIAALALPDRMGAAEAASAHDCLSSAAPAALRQFAQAWDKEFGGFGNAPKFPRPSVFHFLMLHEGAPREMALQSLRALCAGGIHEALGGGFHRYSVDRFWHVPHFEKMLYDQAQIICALVEAWQLSGEDIFRRTALDTTEYMLRDLLLPEGGLASAEDADSAECGGEGEHAEGAFYVWSASEIQSLLTPGEFEIIRQTYNIRPQGNAPQGSDPHGEFLGKNILHANWETLEKMEAGASRSLMQEARQKLFHARTRRPRPHRDDKVLAAWNGLALSALARAGLAFSQPHFLQAAEKVAGFLHAHLWDGHKLYRSWCGKRSAAQGFAEDYAFLAAGLLDLYMATGKIPHLEWAAQLQDSLDHKFWDNESGGYFTSAQGADPCLEIRSKGDHDGAEPLAESVAALNLLRLQAMGFRPARSLSDIFQARAAHAESAPTAFPALLAAWELSRRSMRQAVIAARPDDPQRLAFLEALSSEFAPGTVVLHADGAENSRFFDAKIPEFASYLPPAEGALLYLCENFVCHAPFSSVEEFRARIPGTSNSGPKTAT